MTSSEKLLPNCVKRCHVNGKEIYLVGTAHVSKESVEDVKNTIEIVQPDAICVELCEPRRTAMIERENWKKMDIFEVIRSGKAAFLLSQLIMTSFYKRIGEKLGVQPGGEMLEAMRLANERGVELVLADREVEITLKRVWRHLSFWSKVKMLSHMLGSFFLTDEIDEEMVNSLKQEGQLDNVMQQFAEAFPQTKERLIDERDIYLSQQIRKANGTKVVAVVGAGHVNGILDKIQHEIPLEPLREIPPASKIAKSLKWLIPLLIISLFVIGFMSGGVQESKESIYVWVISHVVLASLGAAIALAHPLTILATGIVAPFTSLNPMIAAGWVAGLVQAWIKKPTVQDLENLPTDITSLSGFWKNPATRVLLTVILVNLGSSLATFISGSWIVSQLIKV